MTSSEKKLQVLSENPIFNPFKPEIRQELAPKLIEHKFAKDEIVCMQGDESDGLFIIETGKAEITVSSSDGKIIILGTLSDGDLFGEVGLLDQSVRSATVTAKSHTVMYELKTEDFDKIARNFGYDEWMAITGYICNLFRSVTTNLQDTVFLDTGNRLAKKLLQICEDVDGKTCVSISQENLGRMLGLSREATNKALSGLEADGLITREYKTIVLPDVEALEDFVAEED